MNKITIQIVLFVVAFVAAVWFFSDIFIYVSISLVLATILAPVTDMVSEIHFYKLHVPRALAILVSYSLFILLLVLFGFLFVPLISEQVQILSNLKLDEVFAYIDAPIQKAEDFLRNNSVTVQEKGFILKTLQEQLFSYLSKVEVKNIVNDVFSITGNLFISVLAIVFITFFLLYEKGILKRFFLRFVPNAYFEVTITTLYKIDSLLTNYLIGLLVQMLSIFTIVSIGAYFVGLKYALTVAVFAAIANLIPYLGPILGGVFGLLVAFSTTPYDQVAANPIIFTLKIIIVFAVAQFTDNMFLQPIIFSRSVKAHPLEIFIVIFAGAALAGAIGMITAIPVYTILRVSAKEVYIANKQYHVFARLRQ